MLEFRNPAAYEVRPEDTALDDIVTNAREHPDHVAVSRWVDDAWVPVTCRALADEIEALAAGLIAAGIQPGERVGLMSRTRFEWLVCDFAILSVGGVTVPVYETSSQSQIEWILSDSDAVAIFVETDKHGATVQAIHDQLPALRSIWTFDEIPRLVESGLLIGGEKVAERRSGIRSTDVATIVYTSGTTGRPKGCPLTHGNLVGQVRNVLAGPGVDRLFNDKQSTLLFLPLAHILARVIQNGSLSARVRLGHLPDMRDVPQGLKSFQPTVVLSVPRVFEKVYNTAQRKASAGIARQIFGAAERAATAYSEALDGHGPGLTDRVRRGLFDRLVYSKIRTAMGGQVRWAVSGGAPLGARLGHFFRGVGVNVLEGYGLTETTAAATLNLPTAQRVGSVGRPIPGTSIRIAPDGEILLKGVQVFQGYWHNEDATREVFDDDGWFRTGDIGHLDDDGFLFITDRKKDLIVTAAGKNVAPAGLEDQLRSHWLVSQAFVFGDRRPYVAALLTLDAEAFAAWKQQHTLPTELSVADLVDDPELHAELQRAVDAANAEVSNAEAIKRWMVLPSDFSEELGELTPTLKLRRGVIAEEYASDVEALYR